MPIIQPSYCFTTIRMQVRLDGPYQHTYRTLSKDYILFTLFTRLLWSWSQNYVQCCWLMVHHFQCFFTNMKTFYGTLLWIHFQHLPAKCQEDNILLTLITLNNMSANMWTWVAASRITGGGTNFYSWQLNVKSGHSRQTTKRQNLCTFFFALINSLFVTNNVVLLLRQWRVAKLLTN